LGWNKNKNIRDAGHWLARKIELIELKNKHKKQNKKINIKRGGIFNIELGKDNIGGEKNKIRPCLVITRNILNKGDTVVIIPLTTKFDFTYKHNKKIPKYKNHFILFAHNYPFLDNDSCVKCEDIRVIDKIRIKEHLGNVNRYHLDMLENRIKFTFGY
jgi:mRNA interferase MazF